METTKKTDWTEKDCLAQYRAKQERKEIDSWTFEQLKARQERLDQLNRIDRFTGLKNGVYKF